MTGAEIVAKLDELHATGKFFGLSVWPIGKQGYQVNLATTAANNWRVRRADTPSEGLAMVLGMDFMDDDGVLPKMKVPPAVDEPPIEDLVEPEAAGVFD